MKREPALPPEVVVAPPPDEFEAGAMWALGVFQAEAWRTTQSVRSAEVNDYAQVLSAASNVVHGVVSRTEGLVGRGLLERIRERAAQKRAQGQTP